jgi:hypothetical protein
MPANHGRVIRIPPAVEGMTMIDLPPEPAKPRNEALAVWLKLVALLAAIAAVGFLTFELTRMFVHRG